ncbi:MAG: pitrilysin family protein [Clostridia bacterium]
MNKFTKVCDEKLGDFYYQIKHSSGLDIILYPKVGFVTSYAMFSTKYGSIDTSFKLDTDDEIHTVPAGIAHFLEHKLFESEDGDAFLKYAKTGASANAYTSFESTCYLFSTTQNLYDALEILLDFVQNPYFTKESVDKEQGIIGQEIKMYDDDPNWRVMFNLLKAMYHNHTVKEDIAGTTQSISEITPEYLYSCYNTFYNLNNMNLVISGNFDMDKIIQMCDDLLKPSTNVNITRYFKDEPDTVVQSNITEKLSVASPLFQIGYKENIKGVLSEEEIATTEILLDVIASSSSPLFKKLYDNELVNEESFSYEHFEGESYSVILFGGESKEPEKVQEEIENYIDELKNTGINEDDFERAKKSIYGANIAGLNSSATIANAITSLNFKNRELFRYINSFENITVDDVNARMNKLFENKNSVLSLILPMD